ncbi:MAG: hypothetical protein ACRERW_09420 [Pseudomonas sp.]
MAKHLTAIKAAQIVESAFTPLRCVAEPWDYGHRLRFRVFDNSDHPALVVEEMLKNQFSNVDRLVSVISSARDQLIQNGFSLDSWESLSIKP